MKRERKSSRETERKREREREREKGHSMAIRKRNTAGPGLVWREARYTAG